MVSIRVQTLLCGVMAPCYQLYNKVPQLHILKAGSETSILHIIADWIVDWLLNIDLNKVNSCNTELFARCFYAVTTKRSIGNSILSLLVYLLSNCYLFPGRFYSIPSFKWGIIQFIFSRRLVLSIIIEATTFFRNFHISTNCTCELKEDASLALIMTRCFIL